MTNHGKKPPVILGEPMRSAGELAQDAQQAIATRRDAAVKAAVAARHAAVEDPLPQCTEQELGEDNT
jgi:hypothetical protein